MWLVVGLGNPGTEYANHRHNVGFMVVDRLAERWGLTSQFRQKFGALLAQKDGAVLCKPQEFMNLSGQAVQRTQHFYKIPSTATLVVHDELDLPFGKLKVKAGGGHGGHNGLRSMIEDCGPAFLRVRVGIGKPDDKERVVGHVLSGFSKVEKPELENLINLAADAVESVLRVGPSAAMNKFNT